MANPPVHPSPEELSAFSLGQLPAQQAQAVEAHITECEPCCETLVELSGEDTFVGLLRDADRNPDGATVDLDASSQSPADAHAAAVPPALHEHPRFRVLGLVGRGGMGDVYKAQHRMMARTVALKVIKPSLVSKPEAVERFHREVRAAARLSHPNIVAAYDAERAGETHLLAMEFVDGVELSEVVRREGPLPIHRACDYARQAALGLQHAHEMGMVHRDIKPHNLMVTPAGEVKILDFGLASFAQETVETDAAASDEHESGSRSQARLTTHGTVVGTPDYLPPEQIDAAQGATIRSDIYSLGCTLYFLLAGRAPFEGESVREKLRAHAETTPTPLDELRDDVPAGLGEVVRRMMAKDPHERYGTPDEAAQALAPFTKPAAAPPRRRAPAIAALAGIAAVAAAVLVTRVNTPMGVVEVRADPTIAEEVEVVLTNRGREIAVLRPGKFRVDVKEGQYEVELKSPDARAVLRNRRVTVREGQTKLVEVTLEDAATPLERTGEPLIATLKGHNAEVSDLSYARNKNLLASSGYDGVIRLWDTETGADVGALRGHEGKVRGADFSPDGRALASAGEDCKLLIWDVENRKVSRELTDELPSWSNVRFSLDGRWLATNGADDVSVDVWEVDSGERAVRISLDDRTPETFAFSPDGESIVVSSRKWVGDGMTTGGYLSRWDVASGEQAWSVIADPRVVQSVAFSPDGKTLATGNANHNVYLLNAETGSQIAHVASHPSWVPSVAFSPNGKLLASGCGQIVISDVEAGAPIGTLSGHYSDHVILRFVDSHTLASAGYDRDVKLWDVDAAIRPRGFPYTFSSSRETITRDDVESMEGGWKIKAHESRTVRLFEIEPSEFDDGKLFYRAKLKTDGVDGRAYLEMWVRMPGEGEFFSRGLHNTVSGETGWAEYETPFLLEEGQQPDLVRLNLVVEGSGTVWIKDVALHAERDSEQSPSENVRAADLPGEPLFCPATEHYYLKLEEPMSWHMARRACEDLGGHLATVSSEKENEFLYGNFATDHAVWLGATDEHEEGQWRWITGEPFQYTNWFAGEPSNFDDAEHYLVMGNARSYKFGARWNDHYAHGKMYDRPFILPLCEWEQRPEGLDPHNAAFEQERRRLIGAWRVERWSEAGRAVGNADRYPRITIEPEAIVLRADDEEVELGSMKYALDPTATPKHIDSVYQRDPGGATVQLGIYKLEGDTLTMCTAPSGEPRPEDFDDSYGTLLVMTREATDEE